MKPVEAHVYGIYAFGYYSIFCDPIISGVVSTEGWPWLGPTHFDDSLAEGEHLLGGDEESLNYQPGRRGHDKFDDLGES